MNRIIGRLVTWYDIWNDGMKENGWLISFPKNNLPDFLDM
jgi:hypothetical protein